MKLFTRSIFTASILVMGVAGLAKKSFAAQSCSEAVVYEANLAADDDTGADPDLMTEECRSFASTVKQIGSNKYSVLVDCGDGSEFTYDVTTKQDGDMCRAVDATQEKSGK